MHHILKTSGEFLIKLQNEEGAICDPNYDLFNVWETINAIKCLGLLKQNRIISVAPEVFQKAFDYISHSEVDHGFVLHNRRKKYGGQYCIETSSQYLEALEISGLNREAQSKVTTLKKLQEPNGRWSICSPDVPEKLWYFPSVTAFALLALYSLGEAPNYLEASLDFLKSCQLSDGSWGVEWEYYGTPYYPMVPITHVLSLYKQSDSLERASDFILQTQNRNGFWNYIWQEQEKVPSAEMQTALALQIAHYCGINLEDPSVSEARKWLVSRQQKDGSFFGGYFPIPPLLNKTKDETVYATCQAIQAFLIEDTEMRGNNVQSDNKHSKAKAAG